MKRRTLLQMVAGAAAVLPFERIRLLAQPRELTPEATATLHEIAPTVLPSIGDKKIGEVVDRFVEWTKGYREGVPLAHGYGHPRLRKTGPSPVPQYLTQLADLDAVAKKSGGWRAMDPDSRRAALDQAFTKAGVKTLPVRPAGLHVVADLMAFYFRSTEAHDYCYSALTSREVCRPIAITTRKPAPLG